MSAVRPNYAFASDNTAGVCPEALAALAEANAARVPSYGDDAHTTQAKRLFNELFERECEVSFVFNGTAANALVLAAMCQRHHAIVCHTMSHVDNDECGAPEFFTGGSKVLTIDAPLAKLRPADIEPVLHRGHGVHFPKIRAVSLTQATELGTVYTPDELRTLNDWAHARGLAGATRPATRICATNAALDAASSAPAPPSAQCRQSAISTPRPAQ